MKRSTGRRLLNHLQGSFFRGKVPVYHSVSDGTGKPLFDTGIHDLSANRFEQQLVKLKRNHDFVFVDELASMARTGKPISKLISITFDDGYRNFFTNALPVLEHLNIPATMFLTTRVLRGDVLWRDKIRLIMQHNLVTDFLKYLEEQLHIKHILNEENFYQKTKDPTLYKSTDVDAWLDSYLVSKEPDSTGLFDGLYLNKDQIKPHPLVSYGNHTENHYMMSSLDEAAQFKEIENAKISLNELGCSLSESFAIPFGNPGSFNEHTLRLASESGYKTILLARADKPVGFVNKQPHILNDRTLLGSRFLAGEKNLY